MRKLLFLFAMLVAMTTTATAQIELGKYYRLKTTDGDRYLHIGTGSANAYGNVDAIGGDENDKKQWFQFIEATDSKGNSGYKLKSYDGDYITCAAWNVNSTTNVNDASVLLFDGSEESNYTIKWFNTHKGGIRYFKVEYVSYSGKYHPFCDVEAGKNNIASWEIIEIAEQVQFYTVTYKYQYNGAIIATETHSVRAGEALPTAYKAPYVCTTPDGTVTGNTEITIECNLPFEYAETQEGISQWYFIKLHSNQVGLINANADNTFSWIGGNSNIVLGKEDMQTWAFVGNKSNGFKLINKGTGKVLGNDNGIKLVDIDSEKAVNWVVSASNAKSDIGYFCLRIGENGNYLNGYPDGGYTWDVPDAGSTIILTKRETNYATGYYRISYDFGTGAKYIQGLASNVSGKANAMVMTEDTGAASLFYYNGYNMLSYTAGQFVNETGSTRGLQSTAGVTTFIATGNGETKITASSYMHANISGSTYFIDHCDADNVHAQHNFIVTLAETLPVTISAVQYASFYAPVAVTIPDGVTAYYLTKDGISENSVDMTPIAAGETIPANTGVILYANVTEATTFNFAIADDASAIEVKGNLFAGTVAKTHINDDAYILGVKEDIVGLYKVEGAVTDDGVTNGFTNGSHKAYLPSSVLGTAALSAGFTFDFEGTTAIEEVVTEANDNIYYDLSGRRVENPTRGIYIVNGRKVMVK